MLIILFLLIIIIVFSKKNLENFKSRDENCLDCNNNSECTDNTFEELKDHDYQFHKKEWYDQNYDLLYRLTRVLEDNNIPYWLSSGSALGAFRHEEIIPWDDDVDITIPQEYHDKLFTLKDEFEKNDCKLKGGYLPCKSKYYTTFCDYIQKIDKNFNRNLKKPTSYFSVIKDKKSKMHIDIFHMTKIEIDGKIGYSEGISKVYTKKEYDSFFPLKKVNFGKYKFFVPNTVKTYLCRIYDDISIPGKWKKNKWDIKSKYSLFNHVPKDNIPALIKNKEGKLELINF